MLCTPPPPRPPLLLSSPLLGLPLSFSMRNGPTATGNDHDSPPGRALEALLYGFASLSEATTFANS